MGEILNKGPENGEVGQIDVVYTQTAKENDELTQQAEARYEQDQKTADKLANDIKNGGETDEEFHEFYKLYEVGLTNE